MPKLKVSNRIDSRDRTSMVGGLLVISVLSSMHIESKPYVIKCNSIVLLNWIVSLMRNIESLSK